VPRSPLAHFFSTGHADFAGLHGTPTYVHRWISALPLKPRMTGDAAVHAARDLGGGGGVCVVSGKSMAFSWKMVLLAVALDSDSWLTWSHV
jgi:hypothetical protein